MLSRSHLKQALLCLIAISFASTTSAQVLECRDSNGKKLFASVCPKGSTQVREVEILSPPTETKAVKEYNARAKLRMLERDEEFRTRELKKQEADAGKRDNQRQIDNKCYEDKKKLSGLLIEGPIEVGKESDGTPIYMDDKKRLESIKDLGERLKACKFDSD
ncbi:hypothetical protein H8K35_09245 [Undibacterium sp. LX40W]|uniref:DUF4124 domain-containing protein n=1 Tax=Undibacterium nitidum TaxID=2762298 RepID=A0A923HRX9_9BURK|nr:MULTISPECIES: hypothetical protein [Undibacterium]MBC3881377.1 hypothetical protein [Undibacterium nitidum]MBC3891840.1 hypothetical protein [Undibacterium sp. LX40W]